MAYEFNTFYITKNATEEELTEAVEKVDNWCKDRIHGVIDLYFKSIDSPYNYLIREYPILVDDELPPAYVMALINAESPAMFTGDYVAVSTKLVAKTVIEGALIRAEKVAMVGISGSGLTDEILTIIAHEYTHALYNHSILRQRFHKKTKGKDDKTFMLACEIQANRGVYVNKTSLVYELGVTEEKFIKDVPDIATAKTLDNIYIALKNVYKDKIENNQQGKGKEDNNDENQSNKQGQKQQSESGNQSDETGKELNDVQQKALDRLFKQEEKKGTFSGFLHDYSEDEVEDDSEKDARTLLDEYNQRVETAKIKKSLLKLRAVLKGDLSKGKVPTYSRPSRKSSADSGLFKKGKKNDARFKPSILLALDSSGSMSSTTIKQVTEATVDIIKALGRDISNCYICLHDGKVYNLQKLKDYEEVLKTYQPNGGNNFLKVYQKAVELNCDVVLNVGDGLDNIEDWAYCFRKDDNDKTGKGLLKTNKKLTWYDCLVYKLDDDEAKWYYQENYKDEKLGGIKRKTLDLVGSLRPKEDFTEKIEESLKNEIERRNR
jgi:von willebrand factor type A domain